MMTPPGWMQKLVYPVALLYGWPSLLLVATGYIMAVPSLLWPPYLLFGWLVMLLGPIMFLPLPASIIGYVLLLAGFFTSLGVVLETDPVYWARFRAGFLGSTTLFFMWALLIYLFLPAPLFTL